MMQYYFGFLEIKAVIFFSMVPGIPCSVNTMHVTLHE